jgi:bifunctional DNase/RNase
MTDPTTPEDHQEGDQPVTPQASAQPVTPQASAQAWPGHPTPDDAAGTLDADGTQPGADATNPAAIAHFRVMEVVALVVDLPSQYPIVTLQESEPPFRQLSIPLGMAEGVALGHAFKKVPTPRPLTHQLLVDVLRRLNVDVVAVRLVGRTAGTYLGELDLMSPRGREVIPCRPSDGLSVALRTPVPVPLLADERLLHNEHDVTPI